MDGTGTPFHVTNSIALSKRDHLADPSTTRPKPPRPNVFLGNGNPSSLELAAAMEQLNLNQHNRPWSVVSSGTTRRLFFLEPGKLKLFDNSNRA